MIQGTHTFRVLESLYDPLKLTQLFLTLYWRSTNEGGGGVRFHLKVRFTQEIRRNLKYIRSRSLFSLGILVLIIY